jgi:murein DD-endopeptidase MepM/ murein hydrolase activator NlpD
MASGFGYRTDPFTKARKMHEGMDFTAKIGPIYATGDGIVAQADNRASGYGIISLLARLWIRNFISFEQIQ